MYVYDYPVSFIGLEEYLDKIIENEIKPHVSEIAESVQAIRPISHKYVLMYPVIFVMMFLTDNYFFNMALIYFTGFIVFVKTYQIMKRFSSLEKARQELNTMTDILSAERLVKLDVMRSEKEIIGVSLSEQDTLTLMIQVKGPLKNKMDQIDIVFEGEIPEIRVILNKDKDFIGFAVYMEPQRKDVLIDFNKTSENSPTSIGGGMKRQKQA